MSPRRILLLVASGLVLGAGALGAGCADGGPTSDFPQSVTVNPPGTGGGGTSTPEGVVVDTDDDGVPDGVDTNGDGTVDAPLPGADGQNNGGQLGTTGGANTGGQLSGDGGAAPVPDAGAAEDANVTLSDAEVPPNPDTNVTCFGIAVPVAVPGCPPQGL